jgi:hypothetical protein
MGTVDRRARAPAVPEVKVLRTLGSGPFRREPNAAQYCSKPAAGSRATSTSLGLAEPLQPRLAILLTRPLYVPQWQAICGQP